jgi:hypothetical protein
MDPESQKWIRSAGWEITPCRNKNDGCPGYSVVAVKSFRSILSFSFIMLLCATFLPTGNVRALSHHINTSDLPTLEVFVEQVKNGQGGQLRGIFVPGILAAHIVQQPVGNSEFISPWDNIVTQFGMASRLGSTGLLAHNYLAGKVFTSLHVGQKFYLVYGDGETAAFTVSDILQYQALEPNSKSSEFADLKNGDILTYSGLFTEVYNRPGQVIFQTCIESENESAWGRLFVIAKPD